MPWYDIVKTSYKNYAVEADSEEDALQRVLVQEPREICEVMVHGVYVEEDEIKAMRSYSDAVMWKER